VEATDEEIGKLSGVAVDDEAQITDFYTRRDRHGSPEVLLPTSGVSYVDRTTVYLLLDKRHVESQSAGQDAQPLSNSVAAGEQARTHPWWQFWNG